MGWMWSRLWVNDDAFGAIVAGRSGQYGGRVFAAELVNPNFVRLAEAFGAFGPRVGEIGKLPAWCGAGRGPGFGKTGPD